MKPRYDPFPKSNPHDLTGRTAACSKCKEPLPSKPGFRPSQLKCPKCGAKGA